MAWFVYKYPFPIDQSTSYTIIPDDGAPTCSHGEYLCAIRCTCMADEIPACPDLNNKKLLKMIKYAIKTKTPNEFVKLRPTP